MKKRLPLRHIIGLFVAATLGAQCAPQSPRPVATPIPSPRSDISYPTIAPIDGGADSSHFQHTFTFEGNKLNTSIKVNGAVAAGARSTEKVVKMTNQVPEAEWSAGLQWALISDPAQDELFKNILKKLRSIRKKAGLDDDRYAELLSIFVQSIDYCSSPGQPPKYPIETIADGCGDCDDKSRLLGGLLNREGYDAALLVFEKENHMAVGIRTTDGGFMGSGYAYIETTSPSYIGFPSYEYSDVKLSTVPDIVLLGKKAKQWGKSEQVTFLYDTLNRERERAAELKEDLKESKADSAALKEEYNALTKELKRSEGKIEAAAYNKLVDKTNRAANRFNGSVDAHNALVKKVNRSAEIVTYIFEHPENRHGVYLWVTEQLGR